MKIFGKMLVLLGCLFFALQGRTQEESVKNGEEKLLFRAIGHEVLVALGDNSSRVLPIEKEGERHKISFSTEFSFNPDTIMYAAYRAWEGARSTNSYLVETVKCESNESVHVFSLTDSLNRMLPCGGRIQALDCYEIYLTFMGEIPETLARSEESKNSGVNWFLCSFMVFVLGLVGYYMWRKKQTKKEENEEHFIKIGSYLFDPNSMKLMLKNHLEELTSRESELLLLLHENKNKNVERDVILQKVWGDQGAYVGRTLDVFISKLRKKLSADSKIEIKNIRGIGYRLIITS